MQYCLRNGVKNDDEEPLICKIIDQKGITKWAYTKLIESNCIKDAILSKWDVDLNCSIDEEELDAYF